MDLANNKIISLGEPEADTDGTTKRYVDSSITSIGDTHLKLDGASEMSGDLDLGNHKIINVTNPTGNQDVATKNYVDDKDNIFLKLDGSSSMQNDLNLGGNKITNITNPENDQDVTTKSYVDEVNPHIVNFEYVEHKLYASKLINPSDIAENTNWEYSGEISIIDETENDASTKSLQLSTYILNSTFLQCTFAPTFDHNNCYVIYSKLKINLGMKSVFRIETTNKHFKIELINKNNRLEIKTNNYAWDGDNNITSPIIDPGEYFDFEFSKFKNAIERDHFIIYINGEKVLPGLYINNWKQADTTINNIVIYSNVEVDNQDNQDNYCYFRFIGFVITTSTTNEDGSETREVLVDKLSKTATILHTPIGVYDYIFTLDNSVRAPQYSKIMIKPLNIGGYITIRNNNNHNKILYENNLEIKIPIISKKDIVLTNISPDSTYLHYVY